jgi:CRP-like cAMP-binding protein
MVSNRASYFNIEALEDSSVVVIDFNQWRELMKQHICWSSFLISVLQKAFEKKEGRERELLLFDAETRYTLFQQQHPGLANRVRQHMIASYLGITNVALSRVRKKMGLLT